MFISENFQGENNLIINIDFQSVIVVFILQREHDSISVADHNIFFVLLGVILRGIVFCEMNLENTQPPFAS